VWLTFLQTKARLLPNPEVQFQGTTKLNPGTTGRWDLRGKKFYTVNPELLVCWGICIVQNAVDIPTATNFARVLIQTYVRTIMLLLFEIN
jgi:eukaryotic translation initiation factor 2C